MVCVGGVACPLVGILGDISCKIQYEEYLTGFFYLGQFRYKWQWFKFTDYQ